MTRPIRTPRALVVCSLAVALLAVACSKGGSSSSNSSSPGKTGTSSPSIISIPKGAYAINGYGIVATMKADPDGTWTLSVANHSGYTLGKPGIYELAANDGRRISAVVAGSAPVTNAPTKQYTVRFNPGYDRANVGLIILTLGSANYGAFTPPVSTSPGPPASP